MCLMFNITIKVFNFLFALFVRLRIHTVRRPLMSFLYLLKFVLNEALSIDIIIDNIIILLSTVCGAT
jgi:hypothetical protein